jgi:RNA polymerase sigma-70 factor (ECF subfamily)
MYGTAARRAHAADEAWLARAAAEGDASAFAVLYRRYEGLVFNLAYRIGGSEEVACEAVERAFLGMMRERGPVAEDGSAIGPYLCMATRTACHDLMPAREDSGVAASRAADGAAGLEPGQKEIHEAGMRQSERQREALVLRELGGLPYGEIAAIMNVHPDAVAQLIFRARINLSDELLGTMLGSTSASSSVCERALPLIAARDDDQLDAGSADAAWLDSHLAGCERCGFAVEAMRRGRDSYRAWAPSAAAAWLLPATMAKAADLAGADWSREISKAELAHGSSHSAGAWPRLRAAVAVRQAPRRAALAIGLLALLLAAVLALVLIGGEEAATPIDPAAGSAAGRNAAGPNAAGRDAATPKGAGKGSRADRRRGAGGGEQATTAGGTATLFTPSGTTVPGSTSSGSDQTPTGSGTRTTHHTATAVHGAASKPKQTPPAPAPSQAPAPAPTTEEPPPATEPVDESPGKSHGRAEPPGKPPGRPPH